MKSFRGAKAAMMVALHSPDSLRALVCVDNAPVPAKLSSDFPKYIQGFRAIEDARPRSQKEADQILQNYEPVRPHILQTTSVVLTVATEFDNSTIPFDKSPSKWSHL